MTQLYRYVEDGRILTGPQTLPAHWRDGSVDLSALSADALRAVGWVPHTEVDTRVDGELELEPADEIRATDVLRTLRSRPLSLAEQEQSLLDQIAAAERVRDDALVADVAFAGTTWSVRGGLRADLIEITEGIERGLITEPVTLHDATGVPRQLLLAQVVQLRIAIGAARQVAIANGDAVLAPLRSALAALRS